MLPALMLLLVTAGASQVGHVRVSPRGVALLYQCLPPHHSLAGIPCQLGVRHPKHRLLWELPDDPGPHWTEVMTPRDARSHKFQSECGA